MCNYRIHWNVVLQFEARGHEGLKSVVCLDEHHAEDLVQSYACDSSLDKSGRCCICTYMIFFFIENGKSFAY